MRRSLVRIAAAAALVLYGCGGVGEEESLRQSAQAIAHHTIITDGHVDLPYRLNKHWEDVSVLTEKGNFDFVRAREGGLDAPFMSIYTPASAEPQGRSKAIADSLIDLVEAIAAAHPEKFAVTTSPAQVEANFNRGVISLCMGMENGSPIEGDLANVSYFYDRGIRYLSLAHSKDNHLSDSSYDTTRTWHGISDFGREVIREMNRVGIMVDVSHVSDDAFWQIMDVTEAPVIASHSSCRYFLPGFERNISDDMIRRVAEGGGVVQVNFGSTFITDEARKWLDVYRAVRDPYYADHHIERGSEEDQAYLAAYRSEHPFPYATASDVADHIDHIVGIAGIDHVGFGSDFDGVGETLPRDLADASMYPNLIYELLRRDYNEEEIAKIASGNVLRVWRQVEAVAAAHASR